MGVLGQMLAAGALGGVEGAGEGEAKVGEINLKNYNDSNHARLLDQLTRSREERDIALKAAAAKDLTGPMYAAHANYYNSLAESVRRGDRAKNEKPTLPHVIVKDDGQGNQFLFDEYSGSVGTVIPGAPAQEGKSHWFSADEPGKPAQPSNVVWRGPGGDILPNGLLKFYPDLQKRSGGELSTTPRPVADPLGIRPPLSSMFTGGGSSQPVALRPQPATPQARPQVDPEAEQEAAYHSGFANAKSGPTPGSELDAARARFSTAAAKVRSYGMLQRKNDPAGWERAKDELKDALSNKQEKEAFWQTSLGPQPTGACH